MTTPSAKLFFNKRKEPRNSYSGLISFVYRKNLYTGHLINYSPSGLFIESDSLFVEGEMITVTLPVSKYKNYKQKGQIVWQNDHGCGVQLFG
jgi:Tfp pilus assembly protein PilZ